MQKYNMNYPAVFMMALCAGTGFGIRNAAAEITLPPVLSSHMVLQREMPVPIWGAAAPGEKVTVTFRDQRKMVIADAQGKWFVKLDPMKGGGPDGLTVAGANTVTLEDVLVGEVWLGSGQSNMALVARRFATGDRALADAIAGAPYPKLRLIKSGGRGWEEASPENVNRFSALLFSFGLPLQQQLGVPVGLMLGAVSGTPSGYWLSEQAYASDPACKAAVARFALTYNYDEAVKNYPALVAAWEQRTAHARLVGRSAGRRPAPPLRPGECDAEVGHLYEQHIRPFIPYGIRGVLWDQGESGTAIQGVDQYTLMGTLIRGWRQDWGQGDFPFLYVQKPSGGGCAWNPADPLTREASPFAPLPLRVPNDGYYRETHIRIMEYPNTAMVTSSDLGGKTHPVNKFAYGARACRVALAAVYGQKLEYYGPLYDGYKIQGNKIRIHFTHIGGGLAAPAGEKLQGFAIASPDGKFSWADAVIDGADVLVSGAGAPHPVAVRYAWAAVHPWANLFNKDGLPALAFRTDRKDASTAIPAAVAQTVPASASTTGAPLATSR